MLISDSILLIVYWELTCFVQSDPSRLSQFIEVMWMGWWGWYSYVLSVNSWDSHIPEPPMVKVLRCELRYQMHLCKPGLVLPSGHRHLGLLVWTRADGCHACHVPGHFISCWTPQLWPGQVCSVVWAFVPRGWRLSFKSTVSPLQQSQMLLILLNRWRSPWEFSLDQ